MNLSKLVDKFCGVSNFAGDNYLPHRDKITLWSSPWHHSGGKKTCSWSIFGIMIEPSHKQFKTSSKWCNLKYKVETLAAWSHIYSTFLAWWRVTPWMADTVIFPKMRRCVEYHQWEIGHMRQLLKLSGTNTLHKQWEYWIKSGKLPTSICHKTKSLRLLYN